MWSDISIGKLIEAKDNRVLVNKKLTPPEKDFKAMIKSNRIIKIGVDVSNPSAYFCAPMYKFSKADFLRWIAEMDGFINRGKVNCYAEDTLNEILREATLYPLYFKEFCMEIDTVNDLEKARNEIYPKIEQRQKKHLAGDII